MSFAFPNLARLAASAVLLITVMHPIASASDRGCRESGRTHRLFNWSRYQREADHGLIRYPIAAYWWSGESKEWSDAETPGTGSQQIAPSPWSYNSIAPFASQYHFFYGTSYGPNEPHDCSN